MVYYGYEVFNKEKKSELEEDIENKDTYLLKKALIKQFIGFFVVSIILIFVFMGFYRQVLSNSKQECLKSLENTALSLSERIGIQIENDVSILGFIADTFADLEMDKFKERLISHPEQVQSYTVFERVDIVLCDGTGYTENGEYFKHSLNINWNKPSRELFVSLRTQDYLNPQNQVVYFLIPIESWNKKIGAMCGVLNCRNTPELFYSNAYNGQAGLLVVDKRDGSIISSEKQESTGKLVQIPSENNLEGYKDKSFSEEISAGKTGIIGYKSISSGQNMYVCYSPISDGSDGGEWIMALAVQESVAFSRLEVLRKNMFLISVIVLVIILFFLLNNFGLTMRLIKQAKIREQLYKAEAANQAKSSFLFTMSHDIRTPMNAILGYTELLKKEIPPYGKAADYLDHVSVSGNQLLNLINNVLDMSRIESGKLVLEETLCDLHSTSNTLNLAFERMIREKRLTMEVHDTTVHRYVYHDEVKMEQIMMNIIGNAIKYSVPDGRIDVYFSEEPTDEKNVALFSSVVKDTGIGISEEFLPHVFEDFSREKTSTENKIAGTGLGLGIVKKLVTLMNGTVTVESELGKGTTVTVKVPHRYVEDADFPQETKSEGEEISLEGKTILVAEDNELNAEIIKEMLTSYGAKVEHAQDGGVCLHMLSANEPGYYDAILMDVQMPKMDGLETTAIIRKMPEKKLAEIPIIAMTANVFTEDQENCRNAGMNAFVGKPIQIKKLVEVLSGLI